MKGRKVWKDGAMMAWEEATVSAFAHAMQRGSLVFDVLSFHATRRGPAVFRLREHVERLLRSASLVGMVIPYAEPVIEAATIEAVRASGLEEGLVRLSAFFPGMEADLVPANPEGSLTVIAYAHRELLPSDAPPKSKSSSYRIRLERELRKPGPSVLPPQAKVSAAYLSPMLARKRALAEGFDEVVLLDLAGNVAEAPTANVFAVRGGELVTPRLDAALSGITRDTVLVMARAAGLSAREENIGVDALLAADEVFLTSTSLPLRPVVGIDGRTVGSGEVGPVTQRLRDWLATIQRGEDEAFAAMLRWVD